MSTPVTYRVPVMDTTIERFYRHVDRNGPVAQHRPDLGPCHLWTASCFGSGYGQFKVAYKNWRAHRWLWLETRGPVPERRVLDHFACDNRACVNLDHLRPVTERENLLRSQTTVAAVNRAKTHCPQGHPYSGDNLVIREKDNARICVACRARVSRESQQRKRDREKAAAVRLADPDRATVSVGDSARYQTRPHRRDLA